MKRINRILVGLFLCFIGGIASMQVLTTDIHFSEAENRVLSQMPNFTLKRFLSGTFTKEFEMYVSDQFAYKEYWTAMKASAEKSKLKQENNGVYFGKDGYLLEAFKEPGEQLAKNIASLAYFTEKAEGVSSYLMLVPTSIGIYPEKLPLFAPTVSQKESIESTRKKLEGSINWIDIYNPLISSKSEQVYFRTDHHWTSRGAYIAYKAAADVMDYEAYDEDDFTIETVSDKFYGTHYAKANDHGIKPDAIEIYKPKFDHKYQVNIEEGQSTMDTLYDWDYLKKRDQYALFLGGNHRIVDIKSNVKNGRKLMLIKDSYAHMMVPFLINHFEEIYMIDLRYFHDNLYECMNQKGITDVLYLYNIATFSQDSNLIWLRQ